MQKIQLAGLHLWQFEQLSEEQGLNHFVSDRNANGTATGFNLSFATATDRQHVVQNRSKLAKAMGIAETSLFIPAQVHKANIIEVKASTPPEALANSDALITRQNGVCLAVLAADCVPILLYDRKNKAVGAVHSGWRGTVARILQKTLLHMQQAFGSQGEDIMVGIGPSVCQQAYEVGPEVVEEVLQAFGPESGLLEPQPNGKAKLDLWKANLLLLQDFGVPPQQIELANLCTVKNNTAFFSARKGDSGRFAAGIMLV